MNGRISNDHHTLTERVYFEHTDFSGVVYHTRYLDFLEHGRSDYVRMLGVHHRELAGGVYGESLAFAVHHMDIAFKAAARIDDVLTVTTHKARREGIRLHLHQTIHRGDVLLIDAHVVLVLVNTEGKPRRFPTKLIALLEAEPSDRTD